MNWKTGNPKALLADLRVAGWVQGQSSFYPQLLRLHKTDLMTDVRTMPPDRVCLWRIAGDPHATGRYASNRRSIVLWLGK